MAQVAVEATSEFGGREIARTARLLFEETFARAYRTGRKVRAGPRRGPGRNRMMLVYDYLERAGVIERLSSGVYQISELGQRIALQPEETDQVFATEIGELRTLAKRERPGLDAAAIRSRAKELFNEHFATCDRYLNVIAREPLDVQAMEELARKGLAEAVADGGPFMIGEVGVAVCMGEVVLDEILGLAPPRAEHKVSSTTNNFYGSIGAVAAASGAVAHGSVQVQQIDQALRRTVEVQDELGELADLVLPLLRAARKLERSHPVETDFTAAMSEAEELRNFAEAVKNGPPAHAATALKSVLELVPTVLRVVRSFAGAP